MTINPYELLAERLDALPNGFPRTKDGIELRLLAYLFSPEQADLAAQLRITPETPEQIATRLGKDAKSLRTMLKGMAKHGLINAEVTKTGLGYALLPFVVGIYEMQISRIDGELAHLFEDYYRQVFHKMVAIEPQVHRVIPVYESVRVDLEILPYENIAYLLDRVKSWGVMDCICRKQKALLGEACKHPVEVCMVFSEKTAAFDHSTVVRALSREEAMAVLRQAAQAGLVHSVSNNQQGVWYVCNCCTCSCGILRAMAERGMANVIARSSFVIQVDESHCLACGDCVAFCQFHALSLNEFAEVDKLKCVGCGVCVPSCLEQALTLVQRPAWEIKNPPVNELEWNKERAQSRGISLDNVL
jgi:electron transport complex protein RnfB